MYNDEVKFSLWCDFIERDFLGGEFVNLIQNGVISGVTSNPAIFKSAFTTSEVYKETIKNSGLKYPKAIYERLATQDIKIAATKLFKNYANGDDGFVSIEVDPTLSDDAAATTDEGVRLYGEIAMPNVMIKIPATKAGFEAMSALTSRGINVNATLIFSPEQAMGCLDAFEEGCAAYAKKFPQTPLPKSVISIFVSRFDRLLDERLRQSSLPTGQVGIMNAAKIYNLIEDKNLPSVRALFASTGVKGGDLRPDYYVRELMYKNAVNTAPLDTVKEFIKERAEPKNAPSAENINSFFEVIKRAGIDMNAVYKELMNDGLKAFEVAFNEILRAL